MLVKAKTTIETEINIDFPVYVEYAWSACKVISEDHYIRVTITENSELKTYDIEVRKGYKTNAVMLATEGKPIPHSQFDEAVVLALQHIHNLAFEKVIESNMGIDNDYPPIGNYKNNDVNNF